MSHQASTQSFSEDDLDRGLDEAWDDPTREETLLPQRQRVRWLNAKSVLLLAVLTGLIGFYAGIREEKSSATTTSSGAAIAGTASGKGATKASSKSGSAPSFGSGAAPGGASFGGGIEGTIVSVDGDTVYVKETSGDTVKVKLLSTTTLSKSSSVGSKALHPGDTISVDGKTGSKGTITATSVSDSGATSTSTTSTASATG